MSAHPNIGLQPLTTMHTSYTSILVNWIILNINRTGHTELIQKMMQEAGLHGEAFAETYTPPFSPLGAGSPSDMGNVAGQVCNFQGTHCIYLVNQFTRCWNIKEKLCNQDVRKSAEHLYHWLPPTPGLCEIKVCTINAQLCMKKRDAFINHAMC